MAISEPINLIHIESTNVNGEIHIVRVGVDWPDEQLVEPEAMDETDENALVEEKETSKERHFVNGVIHLS